MKASTADKKAGKETETKKDKDTKTKDNLEKPDKKSEATITE